MSAPSSTRLPSSPFPLRSLFLAALFAAGLAPCAAQAQELVEAPAGRTPRIEQKVEKIHVQDKDSTIDEVRYGGQTERITVQPKNGKAYDVSPMDGPRRKAAEREGGDANGGQRTWRVMGF